ncbi:hypothetical protein N7539_008785 [Penicillium diatomitis]|uniref:Uncharacterized protein n=1 Tax=Penicillium diatomitis TaxID=2819901 RepID=A0A9W9WRB5_9EURO|nr:uncharacterized protein N7539_008785 [Penicillium diatomitis]KAJ5471842.1 hypothetical protein N7539_008785 [Penicillium diatomitis]
MGSATLERHLDIDPERIGRPRLDPHERLLCRFYEPLFLLNALGQTRGNYTTTSFELDRGRAQVRRFLQNLCFICDLKKGGSACTAIGLEELDTCYNFCIASNRETRKIAAFLKTSLGILQSGAHLTAADDDHEESRFLHLCLEFATDRIEGERKCLCKSIKDCLSTLHGQSSGCGASSLFCIVGDLTTHLFTDSKLIEWLEVAMNLDDHFQLCIFAYETRYSDRVAELSERGMNEEKRLGPASKRSSFLLVRHYVGRLAQHIRAPKQLIDDMKDLSHLLESHTVYAIDALSAAPPPTRDSHVNLRGILNRMFKESDQEWSKVKNGLLYLDKVGGVFEKFLLPYERCSPEVHAEVQVLDHFYKMRKSFAGDDCFVACSKPACFCCEMYFKYHPTRATLSCSHHKIWTNWSPPNLNTFDGDNPTYTQQRDILNLMTNELREQVITQVLQRLPSSRWHPDSMTNITSIRCPDVTSLGLEVPNAENTKTPAIIDLTNCPKSYNRPPETAFPLLLNEDASFNDVSDAENGGVSLFDYCPSTCTKPG